jgi:hypothetical protein
MAVLGANRGAIDTRVAIVALAFLLASVSMPVISGWVVADSHCAITMDICHPVQASDVSHAPLFAPAPQVVSMSEVSREAIIAIDDGYRVIAGRFGDAPDPPPPKTLI